MKRYIYIFILTLLTSACAEKISSPSEHVDYGSEREDYVTRLDDGMMVLGEKLNNPYSLSNMQAAYDELCKTKSLSSEKLEATDLYVRFLPKDSTDIAFLQNLDLEFFDFPLDYEIEEYGNYYHDPSVPEGEITWQYTKVKPDFVFPDIQYEIIDECYIPEEDEELTKSSICGGDFAEELEMLAIKMADLPAEYSVSEDYIETKAKVKKYPSGSVLIYKEDNDTIPAKGVKIRCHYFLKWDSDFTDDEGNYNISKKFSCNPTYAIILDNVKGFKVWGNWGFLAAANHNVGRQNKSGYNFEIYNNSQAWKWLVINNAAYDYYKMCERDGIKKPPTNLKIWCWGNASVSSAPMLHHLVGLNATLFAVPFATMLYAGPVGVEFSFLSWFVLAALPDVTIGTKGKDYKDIYTVVWHELSHASHFSQAGEGLWGRYVNYIVTHGGYGDGTAEAKGKEICELGESWAYAHERYCSYLKFGDHDNSGQSQWFAPSINSLYYMFSNKILSPSDVYKSLTSKMNSVNDLCCKLDEINDSPIDVIFAYHGALSNQTIWKIRNNTSERLYVYLDREYCSVNCFIDEY